ncbi:enoyl-CoA hydratase/isomerase family protein [Rhodococcus koreensis]
MRDYEYLDLEQRGLVTWVRLNRPERLNALSTEIQKDLIEAVTALEADDSSRVIVLATTSAKAFSVGADLKEVPSGGWVDPMRAVTRNVYEAVFECRKPTIAAVRGWAVGGGMELAMACDMRLAAADAQFRMPEGRVGMAANFGSQMLPRLVPWAHAFDILYRGETFGADHAERIGLVSEVCPVDLLDARVGEIAEVISTRAPLSLRRFKAMIQQGSSLPVSAALRLDPGPSPYLSKDRVEGAAAFKEKREPRWTGE